MNRKKRRKERQNQNNWKYKNIGIQFLQVPWILLQYVSIMKWCGASFPRSVQSTRGKKMTVTFSQRLSCGIGLPHRAQEPSSQNRFDTLLRKTSLMESISKRTSLNHNSYAVKKKKETFINVEDLYAILRLCPALVRYMGWFSFDCESIQQTNS